jgi:hypothetical protein
VLSTPYDDGGFSGGTIDRPALQRLLADIQSGRVNVVVVYKIDRLTRSLFDFAKIVEAFDAKGASFVSVTQQFNTTTSMGRLTLNVLLSFAQFEREVTGERIRDMPLPKGRACEWVVCHRSVTTCRTGSWSSTNRRLLPSAISFGGMFSFDRCVLYRWNSTAQVNWQPLTPAITSAGNWVRCCCRRAGSRHLARLIGGLRRETTLGLSPLSATIRHALVR